MAEKSELTPRRSFPQRVVNYFRESRAELSRVTWPTRQEIVQSTEVILLVTVFFMVVLGLYDLVFRNLISFISR
ncbi:MAG TPA: preprotein translocase subunit SecE [Meiothermus sp.]|jgi:preprotein translocase subunit SecE|uniref:Protein translocase subunit SecE n=1 Tax=Allomeiothermus silvanus (strain ATCC 700542 / DSM 9946 / NBRC 106475 / NCIMB 13440 / VI-R2) TaxID=526227 RepID=D7BC38_ALLS1|nr:preprotein translocase subunit SecE [Allomeiothermus silvanus]ADH64535.1 preprotein translocase, SecE subunit [Allomeiothermus silvanus DSM 9946]MCL6569560.1 preprotein translocase subunit SecE [Allomeiothermus silvanus]HEU4740036.1 preprotein translocase subunit SecE [Meiothermus sp.]